MKIAKLQSCKLRILLPCAININLVNKAWNYVQSEIEHVKILQLEIYFQQMQFGRSSLKLFLLKWRFLDVIPGFYTLSLKYLQAVPSFSIFFVIMDTELYSLMPHLWTPRRAIPRVFLQNGQKQKGESMCTCIWLIEGLE